MKKCIENKSISAAKDHNQSKQQTRFEQMFSFLPFKIFQYKTNISVLRLEGIIGNGSTMKKALNIANLSKLIDKAFSKNDLEAVCLIINSPGGSPVQSELIAKRISSLAKEKNVKLYAFIEDIAASGGYWLACCADKIFATRNSIVGSVGVISAGFGFVEAIRKIGVERRIFTEGKNKSVLDPFQPIKETDITLIKKIQMEIHNNFIDYIKQQRGGRITQNDDIVFNGEFWTGEVALNYGLIDGINDLYTFLSEEYGDDIKINYVESKSSFFKKFMSHKNFDSSEFAEEMTQSFFNELEGRIVHDKLKFM